MSVGERKRFVGDCREDSAGVMSSRSHLCRTHAYKDVLVGRLDSLHRKVDPALAYNLRHAGEHARILCPRHLRVDQELHNVR